ncbi:MAG: MATE family efflux transporter [Treponema sp.]|nr:MATE family efflux transporter [Candidatus Treponema equifaecale]
MSKELTMFSKKDLKNLIWPLIAEQILITAIGACDTFMVSSTGEAGISGVSLVDNLSHFVIALFSAFATGGAVVVSQYIGHKDSQKAESTAHQLIKVSFLAGLFFVALCLPFKELILRLVYSKIDADVMMNSVTYFIWIVLSLPFLAAYLGCTALCRSIGNSKVTLKVSFIGNLVNTAGNAILIYGAGLGVMGAGIATFLSRIVTLVVIMGFLSRRENSLTIQFRKIISWQFNQVGKILKIAVPSGVENSFFQVGRIFVTSLISSFGVIATSAHAICCTFEVISNIPGVAIGLACLTVIGQCIGADEKEQAKAYGRKLMKMTFMGMGMMSVLIFFTIQFLILPFNLSDEARNLAVGVIRTIMVANVVLWPMSFTMPNILRGAGDAKYTMFVSNISMWACRVLPCILISNWILAHYPENPAVALYGIRVGMYIDWAFRTVMFGLRFHGKKWLEKKVI